jgi:hypothetical protein
LDQVAGVMSRWFLSPPVLLVTYSGMNQSLFILLIGRQVLTITTIFFPL